MSKPIMHVKDGFIYLDRHKLTAGEAFFIARDLDAAVSRVTGHTVMGQPLPPPVHLIPPTTER